MPMPYKHEKLASVSTIRIIKLEKERIDGKIACTIRHVEQSADDTVYDALSYVWGDPAPTRSICIKNNRTSEWDKFEIHESLWKFLNNIWKRELFDLWLWTDRICLDQSHGSEELGEQIPRMAEIYRNAAQVVAWLGMEDSDAQALTDALNALRECQRFTKERIIRFSKGTVARNFPEKTVATITAIRDSEYWQRIWIVQEFVSAKQIVVVVGSSEFKWDEMNRVLGWDLENGDKSKVLNMMRDGKVHGRRFELWHWLWHITSRDFRSTKPHDLVYGILGLAITYGSGKSQPNLIRKAYYEEPYAFVVIDTLFESFINAWWPWTPMDLLLRTTSIPDLAVFTAFDGYVNSDRTSQRHKQLAYIFLQTCDAFFSVSLPEKLELHRLYERFFWNIVRQTFQTKTTEYVQHNAVLWGLFLVFNVEDKEKGRQIFQDWKDIRQFGSKATGPWKCRNHLPCLPRSRSNAHDIFEGPEQDTAWAYGPVDLKQDMVFAHAPVALLNLDPNLKQACSAREDFVSHSDCHESIVGFQIPEAGFRLELDLSPHLPESSSGATRASVSAWFWPPEDENYGTDAVQPHQ